MKLENRTLVWIIVLLVVFNLSTLGTIGYHLYQTKRVNQRISMQQADFDGGVQFNGRYFRDSLALSSEQMDKFREINHPFRIEANQIATELASLRKQMMQSMASNTPDTILLNSLSDSIGTLHAQLKKKTYRYYLEIKSICTPEQTTKLNGMFEQIFSSNDAGNCNQPGMGRHYRGGRGPN